MSMLRIGVVGLGRAGAGLHLPAIDAASGVEAVAVCDVDEARAREVAARFGIARTFTDPAELAASDVDLVAVCTPPHAHAAVAIAALEAGRHVMVEKPLTPTLAEADAIADAAGDRVVATGFNLRLHRQVVAAREAVRAGRLGRLLMLRTHWSAAVRPPGWDGGDRDAGDALWDMGIHHFDLWRHLGGGEPGGLAAVRDATTFAVSGRTAEGVVVATTLALGGADANEVELIGEHGRMTLTLYRGDGPLWAPTGTSSGGPATRLREAARAAADLPRQARVARAGGDYRVSFVAEWEALRAAVRDGAPPPASLADGRAAVALALDAEAALPSATATA